MKSFFLLLVTMLYYAAYAQNAATDNFRVVYLPFQIEAANPLLKDSLNNAIGKINSRRKVYDLLSKRLGRYKNMPVKVRETVNGVHKYYLFADAVPVEPSVRIIDIKGAKLLEDATIYKKYQFRTLFADTLAVIGTLELEVFPDDFSYPIGQYYFLSGNDLRTVKIPSDLKHRLYIADTLFGRHGEQYVAVSFRNTKNANDDLGNCYLHFMSPEELNDLHSVLRMLREDDPLLTAAGAVDYLQQYVGLYWGYVPRKNLLSWVIPKLQ